ncbi:hypothetical protein [Kitasatospora cineracea]|uniref:hypothetical protein n=1 Tax=Kitasatospora cineracea TaxID=88074 RepID=UPI003787A874
MTTRQSPWLAGRRDLHWHVLPDPVTARAPAGTWHAAASRPGLNPVPEQWLRVTVLHAGPTSEASGEQIQTMAGLVREQAEQVAPFDLRPAAQAGHLLLLTTPARLHGDL